MESAESLTGKANILILTLSQLVISVYISENSKIIHMIAQIFKKSERLHVLQSETKQT